MCFADKGEAAVYTSRLQYLAMELLVGVECKPGWTYCFFGFFFQKCMG